MGIRPILGHFSAGRRCIIECNFLSSCFDAFAGRIASIPARADLRKWKFIKNDCICCKTRGFQVDEFVITCFAAGSSAFKGIHGTLVFASVFVSCAAAICIFLEVAVLSIYNWHSSVTSYGNASEMCAGGPKFSFFGGHFLFQRALAVKWIFGGPVGAGRY